MKWPECSFGVIPQISLNKSFFFLSFFSSSSIIVFVLADMWEPCFFWRIWADVDYVTHMKGPLMKQKCFLVFREAGGGGETEHA